MNRHHVYFKWAAVVALIIIAESIGWLALAQSTTITIKPEDQAKVKPVIDSWKKAQEPYTARRSTLPESKAVVEAQKALTTAQEALQKALEAQDKAARALPEFEPVKAAEAQLLDELYRMLASYKLSSREYRPSISERGEVSFVRIEPVK